MGSKYKPSRNENPGPGTYSANDSPLKASSSSVRIGTQKIRVDLFGTDAAANQPGPGNYESPSKQPKGFTIQGKKEVKIELGPGPGNYDADNTSLTRQREATVRMSQAKRKDIWEETV